MKMIKFLIQFLAISLVFAIASCDEPRATTEEPDPNLSVPTLDCSPGRMELLPSGETACVYVHPIVIETGFCPIDLPHQFDFQTFVECDLRRELPVKDLEYLNFLDIRELASELNLQEGEVQMTLPSTDELDVLWVIDNTGSICQ